MENEESKKQAEETAASDDSQNVKQTEQQADDTAKTEDVADEQVTISKTELEKLQKKASDFEGIVSSKKQQKLVEKFKVKSDSQDDEDYGEEKETIDRDEILAEAARIAEEAALRVAGSVKEEELKSNVLSASEEWLKENPWADDDKVFSEIVANLKPTSSSKKEDILAELDKAAFSAHPRLYRESMEKRIESRILVEKNKIDVGSSGSAPSVQKQDVPVELDKDDINIINQYFGGDKERYLKVKERNNN